MPTPAQLSRELALERRIAALEREIRSIPARHAMATYQGPKLLTVGTGNTLATSPTTIYGCKYETISEVPTVGAPSSYADSSYADGLTPGLLDGLPVWFAVNAQPTTGSVRGAGEIWLPGGTVVVVEAWPINVTGGETTIIYVPTVV
jgi:hypothetical protein